MGRLDGAVLVPTVWGVGNLPPCFATASDMLADLAAQESSAALGRRLRRYTIPQLLCVHEVGYLSYDTCSARASN